MEYGDVLLPGLADTIRNFLASNNLEPVKFNEDAIYILEKRYLIKDENGNVIETPEEMLARVSLSVAFHSNNFSLMSRLHSTAVEYYNMMASLDFLPNSPTLMNAGKKKSQLAACFVLPIEDSMVSIMETLKNASLIFQSGGGVGYDFSTLRPEGSIIKTTGGTSSGPISFMGMFDKMTDVVKQGGTRRGAQMGMLRVDHPDIRKFIGCKDDGTSLQNFNISVAVTDKFMHALGGKTVIDVAAGDQSTLGTTNYTYAIKDPKTGDTVRMEDAREIWNLIVEHAYNTGDPGIIFIDTINEKNPFMLSKYPEHTMHATNPCGEQPLEDYEACNLGSINLNNFVLDTTEIGFEKTGLEDTVRLAVNFLDDVIDACVYPLPEIDEKVKANRKIGLGIMGFADVLLYHKIAYGSDNAIIMARQVMRFIDDIAHDQSVRLASEREPFKNWEDAVSVKPIRNATVTTIAPTGTISMIANAASSGIEPIFSFVQTKKVMDGKTFTTVNREVEAYCSDADWYQEFLETGIIPEYERKKYYPWFVSAMDITPLQHVKMQASFQDFVDNAVSKTVNMPNDATVQDVAQVYLEAYNSGCKGVTIYRDGSKSDQVLFTENKSENTETVISIGDVHLSDGDSVEALYSQLHEIYGEDDKLHAPAPRPEVMVGMTVKADTPCGHLYVTISEDENGKPFEVFCKLGKSGACAGAVQETMGRLISQELRSGGDVTKLVKQLRGASCGQSVGFGPKRVTSCIDAIGLVLQRYAEGEFHNAIIDSDYDPDPSVIDSPVDRPVDMVHSEDVKTAPIRMNGACPECGSQMEHEGGCTVCRACGFSKCA